MRRLLSCFVLASMVSLGSGSAAAATAVTPPAYIGKHTENAADRAAIEQVIADFQRGINRRDVRLLSSLVLNSNILFASPPPPGFIKRNRETFDTTFDGVRAGGFNDFCRFILESKDALEEKFYNVKIAQDGNVAWVSFDYEFVKNGQASNYGVETWQMMQDVEGKWKIISVVWSYNRAPA